MSTNTASTSNRVGRERRQVYGRTELHDGYRRRGWQNLIPLHPVTKAALASEFHGHDQRVMTIADRERLAAEFPAANFGVVLPKNVVGIDVDAYDDKPGAATLAALEAKWGPLPAAHRSSARELPSGIRLFRVPLGTELAHVEGWIKAHVGGGVEIIRWDHRYAQVAPSRHLKAKARVCWYDPAEVKMTAPPTVGHLVELPEGWLQGWAELVGAEPVRRRSGKASRVEADPDFDVATGRFEPDEDAPDADTSVVRSRVEALAAELADTPDGEVMCGAELANRLPYLAGQYVGAGQITREEALGIMLGALDGWTFNGTSEQAVVRRMTLGLDDGISNPRAWKADAVTELPGELDPEADEFGPGPIGKDEATSTSASFSDSKMAPVIARDVLLGEFLFCKPLGWMRFEPKRGTWERLDGDEGSEEAVIEVIRQYVVRRYEAAARAHAKALGGMDGSAADRAEAWMDGWKKAMSANRLAALARICRGLEGIASRSGEFDADHDVLNTPSGVVNLRTGKLRPASRADRFRKATAVGYVPGTRSEVWDKALEALPEGARGYLQQYLGQALTGWPNPADEALILRGGGENGKSAVLTDGVLRVMGDYAVMLSEEAMSPNAHPTSRMVLFGARLAVMEETSKARQMDEQKIKKIVGTDMISGHYMRCDEITFKATHSLVITTNHWVVIKETDRGSWRRWQMVNFPYTYLKPWEVEQRKRDHGGLGDSERAGDPALKHKIKTDETVQQAILSWLIEGAKAFYANGMKMSEPPELVRRTKEEWRARVDLVMGYLTSGRVEFDRGSHVATTELVSDFNEWIEEHGHHAWTDSRVVERFEEHPMVTEAGLTKARVRTGQKRIGSISRRPAWPGQQDRQTGFGGRYMAMIGLKFVN